MANKSVVVVLLVIGLLLVGCQLSPGAPLTGTDQAVGEVDVPFETIALNESGADIDADAMRVGSQLLLLTSPDQLTSINDQVNPQTMADLQRVDFHRYAVIALFRGVKPSTNYQTVIERITRRDDRLIVYAQFWEPNSGLASATEMTSPYHFVTIDRGKVPNLSMELVLQTYALTPTPPAK